MNHTIAELIGALQEGPASMRMYAASSLVDMGDEGWGALVTIAKSEDESLPARSLATTALSSCKSLTPEQRETTFELLIALLGSEHIPLVRAAISSLGEFKDPRAIPHLEALGEDSRQDPTAWFSGESSVQSAVVNARMRLLKTAIAQSVRSQRKRMGLTQEQLASRLGSSQSRVAKMEASDPSVSADFLLRSFFTAGAKSEELGEFMAPKIPQQMTQK